MKEYKLYVDRLEIRENKLINLDLFSGEMGACLTFFILGRRYNNPLWITQGEKLLAEIIKNIVSDSNLLSSTNNLFSIAYGITLLYDQHFICGDLDDILHDLDMYILKKSSLNIFKTNVSIKTGMLGCLMYLNQRISSCGYRHKNLVEIHVELYKSLINDIERLVLQRNNFQYYSDIFWNLLDSNIITTVFILSYSLNNHIYNEKIENILVQIVFIIESRLPLLNICKLYLLCSLVYLNTKFQIEKVERLIRLLFYMTKYEDIWEEVDCNNESIINGVSGFLIMMIYVSKSCDFRSSEFDFQLYEIKKRFKMQYFAIDDALNKEALLSVIWTNEMLSKYEEK